MRRLEWIESTVRAVRDETPRARTLVFDVPGWTGHRAGQHVDVRLTAEDGYQAERSYSIASGPESGALELTVERLDDGEVSPYLAGEVREGDVLELRGPIGGYFAWDVEAGGPLLLVAGGSGIVPLMSMLRHRAAHPEAGVDARMLVSVRTRADLLFAAELDAMEQDDELELRRTLTRERPEAWGGALGRVDAAMLAELGPPPEQRPRIFVCGPTSFAEAAAEALVAIGHPPASVRIERFGATGAPA